MSDISTFESRKGNLESSPEDVFNFVTDIRNFNRFIPEEKISNLKLEQDECSFQVNMIGYVNFRIAEKIRFRKVLYAGNAMKTNNFSLELQIANSRDNNSEIKLFLETDMNSFLKMVATEPIKQFLETLVTEMEKFKDWKNIR
jgi:carbon monoxide dehydrogenase subunit G